MGVRNMNKQIRKKKRKQCDFCSKLHYTEEIYVDLQICKKCLEYENEIAAIAASIEG
jgi:acetyl-CoA carboxylase beta subunit